MIVSPFIISTSLIALRGVSYLPQWYNVEVLQQA